MISWEKDATYKFKALTAQSHTWRTQLRQILMGLLPSLPHPCLCPPPPQSEPHLFETTDLRCLGFPLILCMFPPVSTPQQGGGAHFFQGARKGEVVCVFFCNDKLIYFFGKIYILVKKNSPLKFLILTADQTIYRVLPHLFCVSEFPAKKIRSAQPLTQCAK